ncbi:MAG: S8 family serine peptidase [Eubacterium sp.]|nr:S8 family serine peptidase [Eubacterium sp.]
MRKIFSQKSIIALALALCTTVSSWGYTYAKAPENSDFVDNSLKTPIDESRDYEDGEVIVTVLAPKQTSLTKPGKTSFDNEISVDETYQIGEATDLAETKQQRNFLRDKDFYVSTVSSDKYSTKELIDILEDKAYVSNVEPDYIQHLTQENDPLRNLQWGLDGTGDFTCSSPGIKYSAAMQKYSDILDKASATSNSDDPVVAIVDTGIDYTHEDLIGRLWVNTYSELDGTFGYNFVDNDVDVLDTFGHGTHCAGVVAAASDNKLGITGTSNAKIMPLKIFSADGETKNSIIINALVYAAKAKSLGVNLKAINCSWGGGLSSDAMKDLIRMLGESGVLFVFAAGNEGEIPEEKSVLTTPLDLCDGTFSGNKEYIINVGASDETDSIAYFSNYSSTTVDLLAPGSKILSTFNSCVYNPDTVKYPSDNAFIEHFDSSSSLSKLTTSKDLAGTKGYNYDMAWTRTDYKNNASSGSIRFDLNVSSWYNMDKELALYYDVTDLKLNTSLQYDISMMIGKVEDGDINWDHYTNVSTKDKSRFFVKNGRTYIALFYAYLTSTPSLSLVIDDFAISAGNTDTSHFGKYEYKDGTSMAAPFVTGAVALASTLFPEDTLKATKSRILSTARKVSGLSDYCVTGAILDLENLDSYSPSEDEQSFTPTPISTEELDKKTAQPVTSVTQGGRQTIVAKPGNSGSSNIAVKTVKIKKKAKKYIKKNKKKTVKIRGKKIKIKRKYKLKLTATISPSNASNKKVKWSVSKRKYAKVSSSGLVSFKKKGIGHTVKVTVKSRSNSKAKYTIKIKITR